MLDKEYRRFVRQQQQLVASGMLGQTAGDTVPVPLPASLRLRTVDVGL